MFEIKLIEEVKKYECIFNKSHSDFRNKDIKDRTWYTIETSVGEPEEKCRLRWKTLRERYVREYLQMIAKGAKYKSQWRYTELMSFMKDYVDPKPYYVEQKVRQEKGTSNTSTKNMPSAPKKFEQSLIAKVQKYQLIYDKDHPDFRNKLKKEEAWKKIARAAGASAQQCRNRWKTLRDRAVVEHSKVVAGRGYVSHWSYFNAMLFMKHYLSPKPSRKEPVFQFSKQDMYCRTCLHQILNDSGQKSCESRNIFETSNLTEQLTQCTNIQIESWDEYPNSVCDMCYEKILEFHHFQLMCRDSLEKFSDLLEDQIHGKYENEVEDTMDNNHSNLTDSTNISYMERCEENDTDNSTQWSNEQNCQNEALDDQIEAKCENELEEIGDGDPLAEQEIYEIITPSEAIDDANRSDDYESKTERVRRSKTKPRKNINETISISQSRNDSTNERIYEKSAHKSRGKAPIIETVKIKRQSSKVVPLEDESDDEVYNSDESMAANQIKSSTPPNRLHFKCNLCPKSYDFKFRLQAHQRTHKILQGYPCTHGKCQRCFSRLDLLQKHLADHNTLPVFVCDIGDCERMYKTQFNLRQHKFKFHNYKEPTLEESCKDQRGYTCEICGKNFSLPLSLRNHRFVHLDKSQWPFPCDVEGCTKRFQTLYFLKLHKKRHAGIRNHICSFCGLRTVTLAELNRHINIHTFERKYPCPFCPKVSKSSADRGNHIRRVHDKPKVYPCRICDGTFTSTYNRDHHEMAHKGIKPYSCEVCNKQFKWKTGLKMHTKIVHLGGQPYECDVCGKEFIWFGSLTKHKKTHLMDEREITQQEEYINEESLMTDHMEDFTEDELLECTFEIEPHEIETNEMESE